MVYGVVENFNVHNYINQETFVWDLYILWCSFKNFLKILKKCFLCNNSEHEHMTEKKEWHRGLW